MKINDNQTNCRTNIKILRYGNIKRIYNSYYSNMCKNCWSDKGLKMVTFSIACTMLFISLYLNSFHLKYKCKNSKEKKTQLGKIYAKSKLFLLWNKINHLKNNLLPFFRSLPFQNCPKKFRLQYVEPLVKGRGWRWLAKMGFCNNCLFNVFSMEWIEEWRHIAFFYLKALSVPCHITSLILTNMTSFMVNP